MTEQSVAIREPGTNVLVSLSERWGVSPDNLAKVVKTTIFRGDAARASNEELVAFLQVCDRYNLNPFIREIYAFVGKGGGVYPIVGVDGWVNLVNRNPLFDGVEFLDALDDKGEMTAITCAMTIKGRQLPVKITEYMAECKRDTEPWKKWPRRMLRHKAYIQCARYAFGYSGIYDEDEADRIQEALRDTRGPIIEMPLSVDEAAEKSKGNGKGEIPESVETASPAAPTETQGAADRGPAQSPAGDPSPEEKAAIQQREQEEAAKQAEPSTHPLKVDRGKIWNAVLRKSKAENKAASQVLQGLTAKSSMAELEDREVYELGKKLGAI